jgi:hypothetical protein
MTIQEIQEQLKGEGIEASEEAIAAKLQTLKIKPEDITDEIQEIAIQDLVQAFSDERNGRAIAPKKRTQKQALAEIRGWFTQFGLNYTEAQLKASLQKEQIDPLEVSIEWVKNWAEQLRSKSLTTVESASPATQPPTQAPTQPQQAIDLETQQVIANSVNGLRSQVVGYIGQQEAQLAEIRDMLGDYNRGLGLRLWGGVAADLKAQGSYDIDIDQVMQNSWGDLKADLRSKIAQVNAAVGVSDAAA